MRTPTTLLVTGGAGFIGSAFVRWALAAGADVVTLDAFTYAGLRANLRGLRGPGRHTLVEGDIRDQALVERILREHDVDTLVHFAAESHVDRSILGPQAFVETNVLGTQVLLDAARAVWGDRQDVRFHHVSTDEVYGDLAPDAPAFTEETPYAPSSPYAASKAASDHLARAAHRTFGLPVTITNCSNNYGPRQYPEKLIPVVITSALAGRPIPVYGDGRQVRDWLHVDDHCAAVWRVLEAGTPGRTYNVGGEAEVENRDLVARLCALLDRLAPDRGPVPHGSLVTSVTDRPGHDRRYAVDVGRIRSELGWAPAHSLAEGLEETVAWYLANGAWLDAVREERERREAPGAPA